MKQLDYIDEEQENSAQDFIMKFQQLTGPLMAKGFEDTTLYIYNRFISQNEVGGSPGRFGVTDEEFHNFNIWRKEKWNKTLNSTSTHDTKRGEDVRARINVLSEMHQEWNEKVSLWNELNRKNKTVLNRNNFPDRNDEYFLYQTLIGTFPFDDNELESYIKRIQEYAVKSVREAKIYTAWIKPNERYENAYTQFIAKILDNNPGNEFLNDFREFNKITSFYGMLNSLSQLIIKTASPGIPDFYQGTELWDLSLVDPDNRHPVDYDIRSKYLDNIKAVNNSNLKSEINRLFKDYHTGEIKMFITCRALELRNKNKELFIESDYSPLKIEGRFAKNLFGFNRTHNGKSIIILVPRLLTEITEPFKIPTGEHSWGDTFVITSGEIKEWNNCFTGESLSGGKKISVSTIFKTFPYAILYSD